MKLSSVVFSVMFGCLSITSNHANEEVKIVGLVAAHNEEALIEYCLRALSKYTDALVFLDDASIDNTLTRVQALSDECHIEKIITKHKWIRDERADKNALLYGGREIGGTHFIMLDADEMFVATCKKDNWLRERIKELKPGQVMTFPMMNIWASIDYYRDDQYCSPQFWKFKALKAVFADDGICSYDCNVAWGPAGIDHVVREPSNLVCQEQEKYSAITDINYGVLHYKFVDLEEVVIKRAWYMCLEFIRKNEGVENPGQYAHNAQTINEFYAREFANTFIDESQIKVSQAPARWYAYDFFDKAYFTNLSYSRKQEILAWFEKYGIEYFYNLDIWNIEWLKEIREKTEATKSN